MPWGDSAHPLVIQLARPRWCAAVESRLRPLQMLAAEGLRMGGVHVPWPGFGRIHRAGEGFL